MIRTIFFFSLFWLPLALAVGQTEAFVCKDMNALIEQEKQSFGLKLEARSSEYTSNYDIVYNRMEWAVNPQNFYIQGTVTAYFRPTSDDFAQIVFDMSDALIPQEVRYHGEALTDFSQLDGRLEISLPQPLGIGALDSVSITYEGVPVSTGFGSFNQSTHGGVPVLWTLSQPYGALDWWPCKQSLEDKIDSIDVIVRTPLGFRAASNGVLVEEREEDNQAVFHWRHRHPIATYLVAIAVTNYAVYSDFVPMESNPPIEVLNYVYPEQLADWQAATGTTVEVMMLFNELFGTYPFADEKYGHAQCNFGGGMEHQTMSFMGGKSHLLQAHELAHQWFGDKVTCGSWADIWLNEGFATYLEGLTYENGLGPNTWRGWLNGKIDHVTGQPNGSVFVDDTTSVNRIFSSRLSYSKGAMLLHMLRWKLGDEDFFQGIRNYANAPKMAFSFSRTADLKEQLEQQSGQDLTEFFSDWFYGQGYPSYRVQWSQEGTQVSVKILQSTSHSSVDFFEMPVPIQFIGAGFDTMLVFDHAYSGQDFVAELPGQVGLVRFDPDLWLVSANNVVEQVDLTGTDALLRRECRLFPNPAGAWLYLQLPESRLPLQGQLLDAAGQLVLEMELRQAREEIDIRHLPAGAYFLRLQSERGYYTLPFVRE